MSSSYKPLESENQGNKEDKYKDLFHALTKEFTVKIALPFPLDKVFD